MSSTFLLSLNINFTRNGARRIDASFQRSEAGKCVKMFLVPRDASMSEAMVPDHLVTDSMIDRFLAIDPPQFRALAEFDEIIDEIERSYVLGFFFAALSASVVSIERLLNTARIEIHKYITVKIPELEKKGPLNKWQPNIDALTQWGYLSNGLAQELSDLYSLRCRYLHSEGITTIEADSLKAIKAAYSLMNELLGFPARLFEIGSEIICLETKDPLVRAFYIPNMTPV